MVRSYLREASPEESLPPTPSTGLIRGVSEMNRGEGLTDILAAIAADGLRAIQEEDNSPARQQYVHYSVTSGVTRSPSPVKRRFTDNYNQHPASELSNATTPAALPRLQGASDCGSRRPSVTGSVTSSAVLNPTGERRGPPQRPKRSLLRPVHTTSKSQNKYPSSDAVKALTQQQEEIAVRVAGAVPLHVVPDRLEEKVKEGKTIENDIIAASRPNSDDPVGSIRDLEVRALINFQNESLDHSLGVKQSSSAHQQMTSTEADLINSLVSLSGSVDDILTKYIPQPTTTTTTPTPITNTVERHSPVALPLTNATIQSKYHSSCISPVRPPSSINKHSSQRSHGSSISAVESDLPLKTVMDKVINIENRLISKKLTEPKLSKAVPRNQFGSELVDAPDELTSDNCDSELQQENDETVLRCKSAWYGVEQELQNQLRKRAEFNAIQQREEFERSEELKRRSVITEEANHWNNIAADECHQLGDIMTVAFRPKWKRKDSDTVADVFWSRDENNSVNTPVRIEINSLLPITMSSMSPKRSDLRDWKPPSLNTNRSMSPLRPIRKTEPKLADDPVIGVKWNRVEELDAEGIPTAKWIRESIPF